VPLKGKTVKGSLSIALNGVLWYRYFDDKGERQFTSIELPFDNWQIIGLQSDIEKSEVLAKILVEKSPTTATKTCRYRNYLNKINNIDDYTCNSSTESFKTLMDSIECYLVNPYQSDWDELCTWGHGDFGKEGKTSMELYKEAQANLSERLILKKV